jgi:hypothetical protein
MKNIFYIALTLLFVACGNDKQKTVAEPVKETNTSVVLYGLYEKDDTLKVIYKTEGYFQYDKPIETLVKASNLPQAITINLPKNIFLENLNLFISHNKEQKNLTIEGVEIIKDGKTLVSRADYTTKKYFLANDGIAFDPIKFNFILSHDKQFAPGFGGSPELEAHLTK